MKRDWVFTLNNPEEPPVDILDRISSIKPIKYMIFQLEKGAEGTYHYQGYVEFNSVQRLSFLKKRLFKEAHYEARRGTRDEAREYCSKEETREDGPWEYGVWIPTKKKGQRTDLVRLREMVNDGSEILEILPLCENFQQIRYVEKLLTYRPISLDYSPREVHWYWGPTGTGKTRTAVQACPKENTYIARSARWFDGYYGQTHVIIDDLRAKNWPYVDMLQLLDGYEVRVENKGGHTIWKPRVVYITAPLLPEAMYPLTYEKNEGGIDQLLRRITEIRVFDDPIYAEMCERNRNIPGI